MTTLRDAAQQVVDYWEQVIWGDATMVDKMDALRAALEKEQVEEFVAWLRKNSLRFFEAIEPQDDSELPPHTIPPKDEPEGVVCARCGALAFDPIVPQQAEPVADE